MNSSFLGIIAGLCVTAGTVMSEHAPFQGSASLPELLQSADGKVIQTLDQWQKHRPELLKTFSEEMYGCMPGMPEQISYTVFESSTNALGGIATRKQIAIAMSNKGKQTSVDLLLYLPNASVCQGPVPLIMALNFKGNHAITEDPAVKVCEKMLGSGQTEVVARGAAKSRWPLEMMVGRGYAVATMAHGDIAFDGKGNMNNNVLGLFPELQERPDNFTAIGAWAWTLSRALDYLEKQPEIDAKKVTVMGHSRLGKTSLWAGVNDPRFVVVISNESGEGGAALSRRMEGETIANLCNNFPYWFCKNFQNYVGHDKEMPFDQHQLLALIAPRHIYVGSAQEDTWADPEGEFTSLMLANPVFKIYGVKDALPATQMPEVEKPVQGYNGYHIRKGKHDVTDFDWSNYLNFLDVQFGKTK